MEFVKLESYNGSRIQSHQKSSALQSYTSALKSNDSSASKNKPRKSSMAKKGKSNYLLNKKLKQINESQLLKTTTTTKFDSTAVLSCLSTPNSKSLQKIMWKKKYKLGPSDRNKIKEAATFQNKEEKHRLVLVFYLGTKVVSREILENEERVDKIINKILRQVMASHQKFQAYYGIVGVRTKNNNFCLDGLLQKEILAKTIIEENVHQMSLKIVTAKNAPCYKNLELHNFQILKYLGNGGFSTVYLARCKIDGKMCALKMIRKSSIVSEKKYQMLENEKNILFCIDHKHIVDLYYAFESQNYIIFGLQFCPNGNLFQILQEHKMLAQEKAKFVFSQILSGMEYLHSQNILFRDLKLENILFDEYGNIKITDFGLSKPDISDEDITYSYCGSPEYMAPQMLAKSGHSFAVDYYALGIVLFELLFGRSPFYAPKKEEIFDNILNSQPNFPKFPVISKEAKSLIQGLLQKNPLRRTGSLKGITQIMSHPWLRNYEISTHSPFKVPFSQQQITLNASETRKIAQQFSRDLKKEDFQKIFFPKSFVNKVLVQNLVRNCITGQPKTIKRNTKSIDYPRIKQR